MIPISFRKPVKTTIQKLYNSSFRNLENEDKFIDLDKWVEENIKISGINGFKDIIVSDYGTLCNIKLMLDENDGIHLNSELEDYICNKLYRTKLDRRLLLESLKLEVCPYCNVNYLIQFDRGGSYQIDHFFPKNKYALLAASFFNLIPCCYSCNHRKSDVDIKYSPHNRTFNSSDELVQFFFWSNELVQYNNPNSINIEVMPKNKIIKENIDRFGLRKMYQKYKYEIVDIIKKHILYPENVIRDICAQYSELFKNENEVYRLLYGTNVEGNDEDMKRPFSKIRRDIFRQLSS